MRKKGPASALCVVRSACFRSVCFFLFLRYQVQFYEGTDISAMSAVSTPVRACARLVLVCACTIFTLTKMNLPCTTVLPIDTLVLVIHVSENEIPELTHSQSTLTPGTTVPVRV